MTITFNKLCKGCNVSLPSSSFFKNAKGKYGLGGKCISCVNVDRRARRLASNKCELCGRNKASERPRCIDCVKRTNHPMYKGTCWLSAGGYLFVSGHWGHPNANATGAIAEHRLIMSNKLGRALMPGENVHHINGNRLDNRPENLELWVTKQPKGQRPEDLVLFAKEILDLYG